MKKKLILVRGLPGSGKSSLAEALGIRAICCADDYMMRDGVYSWDYRILDNAHRWCERKCRRFMKKRVEVIAVTNTLAPERELQPYIDLARQFGYKLFSIVVENRHGNINIHSVPDESLEKMKNRFNIKL
jgi:predicted kinase